MAPLGCHSPYRTPMDGSQYDSTESDAQSEAEGTDSDQVQRMRLMRIVENIDDLAVRAARVEEGEKQIVKNLLDQKDEFPKKDVKDVQGEKRNKDSKLRNPWIYDSNIRVADRAMLACSKAEPQARRVLSAEIKVNGMKAFVLFDSGSESDAMSPDFARAHDIKTIRLEPPVPLQLGCKGSQSTIRYGAEPEIQFGSNRQKAYVDIVNIDRYALIRGPPWRGRHKIVLDFRNYSIRRGEYAIQAFTSDEDASYRKEG